MTTEQPSHWTFSCVESDLPGPEQYVRFIERAHNANRYSNFGQLCEEFGSTLLEHFGHPEETCVPCGSATAGLSAALIASRCSGPVLVPGFTFPATYGAVCAAQLEPLVLDVDPASWAVDPEVLERTIKQTGADSVILVAPFGLSVDFAEHIALCRRHNVTVVIDNAAGLGVPRVNRCTDATVFEVFSLHATKPLGIGEGGAIFCAADASAAVRSALNFGLPSPGKDGAPTWGFNGKLSELHAAVGLAQLARYGRMIEGRQIFAAAYQALLADLPVTCAPHTPESSPWQVFPILLSDEPELVAVANGLARKGVEVRRYYRPSLSQWPGARLATPCPVSEQLASRMLALPVRSVTCAEEAEPILSRVRDALAVLSKRKCNA